MNGLALTGCSWVEGTLTLTKANGFTNYVWASGDQFEVTSGTNVTPGFYTIASRVDASNITLASTIGAGGVADIAGAARGVRLLAATRALKLLGMMPTATNAGTYTFYKADGTTVVHAITFTAALTVGEFVKFGGELGVEVKPILFNGVPTAEVGGKRSAAGQSALVYYQVMPEMAVSGAS